MSAGLRIDLRRGGDIDLALIDDAVILFIHVYEREGVSKE